MTRPSPETKGCAKKCDIPKNPTLAFAPCCRKHEPLPGLPMVCRVCNHLMECRPAPSPETKGVVARIVITPDTCFGAPRIEGTRVTVDAISSRFVAGESLEEIERDMDISECAAEECIRFAMMTNRQREKYLAGQPPFQRAPRPERKGGRG